MYLDVAVMIYVVVIDIQKSWGMILSRKFTAHLGGSLQMDLSYATIPIHDGNFMKLDRENYRRYHVEGHNQPKNEYVSMLDEDSSSYEILTFSLALEYKEVEDEVWKNNDHL